MADTKSLSELRLSAAEREQVAEVAGELIAVQVYHELQKAEAAIKAADPGCINNCCCSSKDDLLK